MMVPHSTFAVPNGYTISNSSKLKARKELNWNELRNCVVRKRMIYEEINELFPITKSKYNAMLKEAGYSTDAVRIRERKEADLIRMYNEGRSIEEIAKAHNIMPLTCRQKLQNLGVNFTKCVKALKK